MLKGKSVLAVVSAASGCKTLPRRDTRVLMSKPLPLWVIDAARNSRVIDRIVVVFNNDEVKSLAQEQGLAAIGVADSLKSGMDSLVCCSLAALEHVAEYDFVVALDGGSPLLLGSDIDGVVELSARNDGTPVVTVSETRVSPSSLVVLDGSRKISRAFVDRLPSDNRMYLTNNALSVASTAYVKAHRTFLTTDTHAYIMPPERALVVESKTDLAVAESFLRLTGPGYTAILSNQDVSQTRA